MCFGFGSTTVATAVMAMRCATYENTSNRANENKKQKPIALAASARPSQCHVGGDRHSMCEGVGRRESEREAGCWST